jgi:predicted RNA-binding Zn-ribbon protein involved in translation (DUF1610 family)
MSKACAKGTRFKCPECGSRMISRVMFWSEKNEWVYSCKDFIKEEGEEEKSLVPCSYMWILSNPDPGCSFCGCGLWIDIRKQHVDYWCQDCDIFPAVSDKLDENIEAAIVEQ